MNLDTQYQEAVSALKTLGIEYKLPSLEQIKSTLTDKQKKYIEKNNGVLVITPPESLYDLIKAFDKGRSVDKQTYVYHELWDQYELPSDWRVDFVLPKLKFTNQSYDEQKKSLAKETKNCKNLESIDPRTYLVMNTILRDKGENLLDSQTFTRFAQLPKKSSGGDSWVPVVRSFRDQVNLDRSYGYSDRYEGLRASVGLDLDFELPATTSSEPKTDSFETVLLSTIEALNQLNERLDRIFKV